MLTALKVSRAKAVRELHGRNGGSSHAGSKGCCQESCQATHGRLGAWDERGKARHVRVSSHSDTWPGNVLLGALCNAKQGVKGRKPLQQHRNRCGGWSGQVENVVGGPALGPQDTLPVRRQHGRHAISPTSGTPIPVPRERARRPCHDGQYNLKSSSLVLWRMLPLHRPRSAQIAGHDGARGVSGVSLAGRSGRMPCLLEPPSSQL